MLASLVHDTSEDRLTLPLSWSAVTVCFRGESSMFESSSSVVSELNLFYSKCSSYKPTYCPMKSARIKPLSSLLNQDLFWLRHSRWSFEMPLPLSDSMMSLPCSGSSLSSEISSPSRV